MKFCSPFDEDLAVRGPAAVFLPDPAGCLRFNPAWTRDAWGRAPGPHAIAHRWTLLRDHDTGFVLLALVTSPTLLTEHPRMDVRAFPELDTALHARQQCGHPPIAVDAW